MSFRNNSGFSFMEVMTVIGILSILAVIATPGLFGWSSKAQLRRAAQDMYSSFQKGKIEAARRNATVAITFAGNVGTVYVDSNGNYTRDGGEVVINTINLSDYPGVSVDSLTFANPGNGIAFAPNGFPINNLGSLASGNVVLKNKAAMRVRISIFKAGNVSIHHLG